MYQTFRNTLLLLAIVGAGASYGQKQKGLGETPKGSSDYKEGEISSHPSHDFFAASLGIGGMGFMHFNGYAIVNTPIYKRIGGYGVWAPSIFNPLRSENPANQQYFEGGVNLTLIGGKSTSATKVAVGRSSISKGDKYRMISYITEYLPHYTSLNARGGYMKLDLARTMPKGLYKEASATPTPGFPYDQLQVTSSYNLPYVGVALEDKVNSRVGYRGKVYKAVYKKRFYFDVLLATQNVSLPGYSVVLDTSGVPAKKKGYRLGYGVSNSGIGWDFDFMLLPHDHSKAQTAPFTACLTWKATFMISQFFTRKKA